MRMCGLRAHCMARRVIVKAARAHVQSRNAEACRRATLDDPPASGPVYMMAANSTGNSPTKGI